MKKSIFAAILFLAASIFSTEMVAQNFSGLDKSPMDAASFPADYREANKAIKVTYSRPQLKGRNVADLAPNGKVWRTGANEAAEITFYKPVIFGKKKVAAGTYSLFTIPGDKEWTVILSNDLNVWGSYFYKESNDVARSQATVTTSKNDIEAFSISFEEGKGNVMMYMGWGKTVISLPIVLGN